MSCQAFGAAAAARNLSKCCAQLSCAADSCQQAPRQDHLTYVVCWTGCGIPVGMAGASGGSSPPTSEHEASERRHLKLLLPPPASQLLRCKSFRLARHGSSVKHQILNKTVQTAMKGSCWCVRARVSVDDGRLGTLVMSSLASVSLRE